MRQDRQARSRIAGATSVALIAIAAGGGAAFLLPDAPASAAPRTSAAAALPAGLPEGGLSPQATEMVRRYPQAVVSARFYRGIETGDIGSYDRVLAADWLDVPPAPGQGPGRAGFASVLRTYHKAFPNLRVHIDEIVVAGDTVTSRNTLTGNQEGPFLGVPATGRRITFRTTDVHHFKRGVIESSYHLEDLYGAYQQVTGKQ